jgi:hypothetical protein
MGEFAIAGGSANGTAANDAGFSAHMVSSSVRQRTNVES